MNQYITGEMIRRLREQHGMTQLELAGELCVSDKAVSRWETGRGYPDIALLESLAQALGVSVAELLAGAEIVNGNRSGNITRSSFYVCPVCGNVLWSVGDASISCCGIQLVPEETEEIGSFSRSGETLHKSSPWEIQPASDPDHKIHVEIIEDEYYITMNHEMTKSHYISFFAAFQDNGMQIVKLYPEGNAEARFRISRTRSLFAYCNRHGLFRLKITK